MVHKDLTKGDFLLRSTHMSYPEFLRQNSNSISFVFSDPLIASLLQTAFFSELCCLDFFFGEWIFFLGRRTNSPYYTWVRYTSPYQGVSRRTLQVLGRCLWPLLSDPFFGGAEPVEWIFGVVFFFVLVYIVCSFQRMGNMKMIDMFF